jgi:hypothetical protein
MIQVGIPGLQAWGIDEKNAHAARIQVLPAAEKGRGMTDRKIQYLAISRRLEGFPRVLSTEGCGRKKFNRRSR